MCSAIARRMGVCGMKVDSPGMAARSGAACGAGGGGGAAAGFFSRYASTSCLVMRPFSPLPAIWWRSRWCSAAMRETTGEIKPSSRAGGEAAKSPARASRAVGVLSGGGGAGSTAGAPAPGMASPGCPIHASSVPTCTVAPASTRVASKIPAAGAGISVSTLSVLTSMRASNSATYSPGFLSHLVMVASVTDSPNWGIRTLVGIWYHSVKLRALCVLGVSAVNLYKKSGILLAELRA